MSETERAPRSPLIKFTVFGLVLAAILIFGSGHADWYRAWGYIGFTLVFQTLGVVLLRRVNPELLVERSRIREGTKRWDRVLMPALAAVGPLASWLTAALDVRAHWPPPVPVAWSCAAFAVCGAGYLITLRAMLVNRFFSATVRIQSERGHMVVDRGPYRYVRHPGYTGVLLFSAATPVALGSWLALWAAGFIVLVLVVRTALEDRTLQAELKGYREYAARVRSRLIPGLW